ncbi:MAG TPA: hypothetical protein VGC32_02810 [Solirubrobacterales bacterium]
MSILTIEWGTLHSSPLASSEPLETELMPTSAYLTPYTPLATWGPVATSPENVAAFMTVTWQPRRGTTDIPFVAEDMTIPSAPEEETGGGEPGSGGGSSSSSGSTAESGSGTGTTVIGPTGGAAQVRAPAAHLATVKKVKAASFLKTGLKVDLNLPEAARVEARLIHRERRKVKGKEKAVDIRISNLAKVRKGAGRSTITLHPDAAGRRLLQGADVAVRVRLEVKVTFAAGTKRRLVRTITLAPSHS